MSTFTPEKRIEHLKKVIRENEVTLEVRQGWSNRNWSSADNANVKAHIKRLEKKLAPFKESHPEEFI